jgi:hypothetical protein
MENRKLKITFKSTLILLLILMILELFDFDNRSFINTEESCFQSIESLETNHVSPSNTIRSSMRLTLFNNGAFAVVPGNGPLREALKSTTRVVVQITRVLHCCSILIKAP